MEFLRIQLGETRFSSFHGLGENRGLSSTIETVWTTGGLYPFSAFPGVVSAVSTSASDVFLVTIEGLSTTLDPLVSTFTMTGITPALSPSTFKAINKITVSAEAIGVITLSVNGSVVGTIEVGSRRALCAIYSVPRLRRAYLTGICFSCSKGSDARIRTMLDGVEIAIHDIFQETHSHEFETPYFLPPSSVLEYRATTKNANSGAAVNFEIILE